MGTFSKLLSGLTQSDQSEQRVVGIDIGSSAIKVVELENRRGTISLTTYGELQLGPYGAKEIGQSVQLDAKQEQTALVDVLREASVKAKSAVFAMPLSSSFVTNISFAADETVNMESRVRVEARKVIPVSLSEVTLDWAEVEAGSDTKSDGARSVMIAAIQNDSLQRFRVLMQFVGLPNPPTEIECFSSIRSNYGSDDADVGIIDIGASSTKMYLVHNGMLARMHRVRTGGVTATKRIASVLESNFEEAEIRKRSLERSDENFNDIQRAHHSCFERSFVEFRQVVDEYQSRTGVKMSTIYLAGGVALFPGIQTQLQDALGIEVLKAHPFGKVAFPAFIEDTMFTIGPSFTVAVGAALRQFE
jgi:type IV pilus assembly protein PilM